MGPGPTKSVFGQGTLEHLAAGPGGSQDSCYLLEGGDGSWGILCFVSAHRWAGPDSKVWDLALAERLCSQGWCLPTGEES